MKDILVPIVSAAEAPRLAERAIALCAGAAARVHLLNVQRPLPRHVARFFPRGELQAFHREAGMAVLAPAARALDAAGIAHEDHVVIGQAAEAIVEFAERLSGAEIVLEVESKGLLSILHAGSIGSQVRHLMQRAHADPAAHGARVVP